MKDILNTYSVKELKQFISKFNKSLGAVKGYSTMKKAELIELMTKAENIGKFKNIKAKPKKYTNKDIKDAEKRMRQKERERKKALTPAQRKAEKEKKEKEEKDYIAFLNTLTESGGKKKSPTPKPAKAPTPKPAPKPAPKPTPKQVSEIEKRTGKSRAEINKMSPADVVKFLPAELRGKIADQMGNVEIVNGFEVPRRGVKMTFPDFMKRDNEKMRVPLYTLNVITANNLREFIYKEVSPNARVKNTPLNVLEKMILNDERTNNKDFGFYLRKWARRNTKSGPLDKKRVEKEKKKQSKEKQQEERAKDFYRLEDLTDKDVGVEYNISNELKKVGDFKIQQREYAGRDKSWINRWLKDGKDKTRVVSRYLEKQFDKMNVPKTASKEEITPKIKQLAEMGKAYVKKNGYVFD